MKRNGKKKTVLRVVTTPASASSPNAVEARLVRLETVIEVFAKKLSGLEYIQGPAQLAKAVAAVEAGKARAAVERKLAAGELARADKISPLSAVIELCESNAAGDVQVPQVFMETSTLTNDAVKAFMGSDVGTRVAVPGVPNTYQVLGVYNVVPQVPA